jgi:DNA-binding YbaB/EbfC family protein
MSDEPKSEGLAGLQGLQGLVDTWQRLQGEVARVRNELGGKTVTGETGGGMVTAVANGRGELVSLTIDPALVAAGEKKMIEDLVVGAINIALGRAQKLAQEDIAQATAGLPIPTGGLGG